MLELSLYLVCVQLQALFVVIPCSNLLYSHVKLTKQIFLTKLPIV